ncbi:MAG: type IX secretion system membrane protein PorP/SprF [Salibacteraceae bacterium]
MKNKTVIVLIAFLTAVGSSAWAQQDPQFSQNMHNKLFFNPAFAGMNDGICAYTLGRQQWVGFEGRPESYLFGGHGTFTIPYINLRSGGGLVVLGDALGQSHFTTLKGMYSAHIPLNLIGNDPGHLGIGASVGLIQFGIGNNWRSTNPHYEDPSIPNGGYQASSFDMDFGLWYQTSKLYFGVSMTHLNQANFESEGFGLVDGSYQDVEDYNWAASFKMKSHLFVTAGYDFPLSNPLFVLKPSVFVKSDLVSTQIDLNTLVEYNNFIWGGLTYRWIDAVVAMAGVNWAPGTVPGTLRAGYAYDVTTSRITQGSNGSHEIFLQYCLKLKQKSPVTRHKSVRFL